MATTAKVEIHLTINPDSPTDRQLIIGGGSTVRVAAMRAMEKAVLYTGTAFRKGSDRAILMEVRRAK